MELFRYCLPALLAGCVAGLLGAGGLVLLDVGMLRELIVASPDGWLAGVLLAFGFVVTFGSVALGGAIIAIGRDEE
jgi:hypothetical protein